MRGDSFDSALHWSRRRGGWRAASRVTVSAVLGQLDAGATVDELLADDPYLEREDVLAALQLLLDANLSPEVGRHLKEAGHDAIHVADIGLLTAAARASQQS
jgi:hypothetical protein